MAGTTTWKTQPTARWYRVRKVIWLGLGSSIIELMVSHDIVDLTDVLEDLKSKKAYDLSIIDREVSKVRERLL